MSSFTLEGYKVLELIGEGAFSKVYLVKDRKLGNYYAAKQLQDKCENLDDTTFDSEVKLIKTVPSHPNLVNIVGLVHANNCLTLIMDLMDMSLYNLMERRHSALSESRARRILLQIVCGLEHLHRNGVFHRDIKPENILIKHVHGLHGKEIVRLGDFGTLERIDAPKPYTPYIATRWYRAPECLLTDGYYGPKMDIWALGCSFYEMVTREPLFPGRGEEHMLELIHDLLGTPSESLLKKFKKNPELTNFKKRLPQDFRHLLPTLSAGGIAVMKKMIAYHPNQRISASDLLNHMYFSDLTNLSRRKKLSTFSQSVQSLNVGAKRKESTKNFSFARKVNLRSRDPSVWSGDSGVSGATFHRLSIEDQTKRKRNLERMWGMTDGPEKRHLSRQICHIPRVAKHELQ
uniref:Protein kinase domain-containing protein n=1 Tax=Anopheles atroparvus TaxID=41427 RepID=A0AAG5D0S8_ANOAO